MNNIKIINSFLWKLLERVSVQGVSFIVSICLARILQPSEYGEIALVMVFINIANVIVDGGFNTALIQAKNADTKDFSTIFYTTLFIASFIYIILYAAAPIIAKFYDNVELCYVVRVVALCLIAYAINSIQRAYISKNMQFKKLFYSSLLTTIVAGVTGIFLAYKNYGIWALVLHYIVSSYLMCMIMFFSVNWKPTLSFSIASLKKLYGYGWKIFMSNFIISLFVNIRSLLIGKYYIPSMLAYFERGKQFPALIMDNINSSIQTVLFPVFSSKQDDKNNIKHMVRRSIRTSSLVIFPLLIGLFAVAAPLVKILLTEKWMFTVPFIRIFCVAYILMPMQIANIEAIKAMGRSDIFLKLELLKKVLEITILIITLFINVYAIAIGVVVYNFICIFINTYPNKKLLGYTTKLLWRDIAPPLGASIVMGIIVYIIQFLPMPSILILILQIASGIGIYLTMCIIFKLESYNYLIDTLRNRRINKPKTSK